jgi:hypothetical protein
MFAVVVGLVIYAMLGALGIRRWRLRHPVPVPNMHADPLRYRAYWLPLIIVVEPWALGSIGFLWLFVQMSALAHDQWVELGLLLGIGLPVVLFVGMDIALVGWTQSELHRRRA